MYLQNIFDFGFFLLLLDVSLKLEIRIVLLCSLRLSRVSLLAVRCVGLRMQRIMFCGA
jgi:hypothetical protein